jgi:hypothetical protein
MNKYTRKITQTLADEDQGYSISVDVYDVLRAFNVTDPAIQHAVKKLLCTGIRGHKDSSQDLEEAIQSIERALDVVKTDEKLVEAMAEKQPVTSDNPQDCPFRIGEVIQHKEHELRCRVEQINSDKQIIWVRDLKSNQSFYIAKTGWRYYKTMAGNSPQPQECPFKVGDVIQSCDAESKTKWKITHISGGKLLVTSHDSYQTPSWIEQAFWCNYRVIQETGVDKPAATC